MVFIIVFINIYDSLYIMATIFFKDKTICYFIFMATANLIVHSSNLLLSCDYITLNKSFVSI